MSATDLSEAFEREQGERGKLVAIQGIEHCFRRLTHDVTITGADWLRIVRALNEFKIGQQELRKAGRIK